MAKLMVREVLFVFMTGLFAQFIVPLVSPGPGLFTVGAVMGLTFMPVYALALAAGRRMPARFRMWLGIVGWVSAFGLDLVRLWGQAAWHVPAASAVVGLALAGLAGLAAPKGEGGRGASALWALYAYSFPMVGVRWLLVPMLGGGDLAIATGLATGAFYMALRGSARVLSPSSLEALQANQPLVHRPVPDRVVGVLEGTAHRRARPYATGPDGSRDDNAVSVLCQPDQAAGLQAEVARRLAGKPFSVETGQAVEGGVEVVVRPFAR